MKPLHRWHRWGFLAHDLAWLFSLRLARCDVEDSDCNNVEVTPLIWETDPGRHHGRGQHQILVSSGVDHRSKDNEFFLSGS